MARNKRTVEDKPVVESSDSEQEEQHNNSGQENSSDEYESDTANPNNDVEEDETDKGSDGGVGSKIPKPKSKPTQAQSESGSESETDSDSDRPSNFTIKLVNSKQQPPTPLKSNKSPSKRAAEAEAEAELGLKELKKTKVEDDGVKKASVIQRLFSEDDEIALLEGISEFQAKKGIDAYSNIPKFHEFIKKSIHFDATSNQLKEKIRRLKNKYQAIVKKSGEDPVISKSHDLKLFNLSKKLWGNNVAAEKAKKSEKTKKDSDGDAGRGVTLALASKWEDEIVTKKQKKVANGGGKKEARQGKGNNGGAVFEGDDAEEEDQAAVYEKGGALEDYSSKFPLCVGGLMEAEGLSAKSKGFLVQKLGLVEKAKLEHYEAELEKIKWAELELFVQKRELINGKLRLLLDSSKSS